MTKELFISSFFEALYFTETGDVDQPPSDVEVSPELAERLTAECLAFWSAYSGLIKDKAETAGHDFWLTRNNHGAGFWDGEWKELGDILTDAATLFGPIETYLGDDGLLYA